MNSTTSVSPKGPSTPPTASDPRRHGKSTPSRASPKILFPDASVPSPRRLHLRRDSSAGLLAGQRRRRDPGERAEPRRQSHRVVPQVRLPAAHPARRADGGVRLLRSGHLPGRLRGARSPRSAARARTVHEDGQVPTLRRGAAAAPGGVAGCLRGVSPGDRYAWGGKTGVAAASRRRRGRARRRARWERGACRRSSRARRAT